MKPRTRFFLAIALLIFVSSIALFIFSTRNQEPAQVFPAVINRDCAPWDGAAFTISLRYDAITTLTISIWQSPNIKFPVTFWFPDEAMQIGIAYVLPELDSLEELSGTVTFRRVEVGMSVEGEFSLKSARGGEFSGRFIAEWGSEVAYCG